MEVIENTSKCDTFISYFLSDYTSNIFILLLLLIYILFYPIKRYIYKENLLVRFNYRIMFFCLFVITANIFSINSNYFNSYNNDYNVNHKYNWSNFGDYLKFPIDQLNHEYYHTPSVSLKSKNDDTKEVFNYFIVLDKTGSNEEDSDISGIKKKLIKNIREDIGVSDYDRYTIDDSLELDKLSLNDLILIELIRHLYFLKSKYKNTEIHYQICFYSGNSAFKVFPSTKKKLDNDSELRSSQIHEVINTIPPISTKGTTRFSEIFKKIFGESSYFKPGEHNNLIIISDFQNEEFKDYKKEIPKMTEILDNAMKDLKGIDLISKLTLFKTNQENGYLSSILNTEKVIKRHFRPEIIYNYNDRDLHNLRTDLEYRLFYNSLMSIPVRCEERLEFYSDELTNNRKYISKLNSNDTSFFGSDKTIFISFNDPFSLHEYETYPQIEFGNNQNLFLNDNNKIINHNFSSEKPELKLLCYPAISPEACLEVSSSNDMFLRKIPIVLHVKIPNHLINILLICYFLVLVLMASNFFIYLCETGRYVFNSSGDWKKKKEYFRYWENKFYKLSIMFGLTLLVFVYLVIMSIYIFISLFKSNWPLGIVLLVSLVLYCIIYGFSKYAKEHFTYHKSLYGPQ